MAGRAVPAWGRVWDEPLLLVEPSAQRSAAGHQGLWGARERFCTEGSGLLWIARRSSQSQWPSKLDHIAAGGQVRCSASAMLHVRHVCCYYSRAWTGRRE
jgi:hypothetical protein